MTYQINREGESELRERAFNDARVPPELRGKVTGRARNAEEAAELAHHRLERKADDTGERWKPLLVDDRRQAFNDDMQKIGQDPDRVRAQWEEGKT